MKRNLIDILKSIQKEYYDNQEQIKQLKWELITPEEQEQEREKYVFIRF